MATIKEVARLAGVSISTVSRALSKRVFVEEKTREKVLKAVQLLAYKPNLMAKGLKEGYSRSLALVIPDIQNPFFPTMIKHLERRATEHGYFIILYNSDRDIQKERKCMEDLKSHYVDGVLFVSVSDDLSQAAELLSANIPVVSMCRESDGIVPCFNSTYSEGAGASIDHLVENGHRKIAVLMGSLDKNHYRQRSDGCLEAFARHGLEENRRFLVEDVATIETAYEKTKELLSRKDRPTAIFVFFDMMAMGVYTAAADCGLSIPGDLSVAGFDNVYFSQYMTPPLTTYDQDVEEIVGLAMRSLADQIEKGGVAAGGTVHIPGKLVVRKSVGRI